MTKRMGLKQACGCLAMALMAGWSAGSVAAEVQSKDNLPAFYPQLKAKLRFSQAWSPAVKDLPAWRAQGRAMLEAALIVPPIEGAFAPQVLDEVDHGSYVARKISFAMGDAGQTRALLLSPKGKGPFPAALLLHDHGAKFDIGKEKLIEPWADEAKLQSAQAWGKRFFSERFVGNALAERGYVVLAVDALGWGERQPLAYEAQQAWASNLFNLGSSLAGLMAREDARAAEFLASLAEVDKRRVAAVGFSLGAYRAWQVAALSDAVRASVAVCWMGTTEGLMVPGNNQLRGQSAFHMTHPGLNRYLDYPDVASLAAPKPALFINGGQDTLLPAESVNAAYDKMRKVWQAWGAERAFETRTYPELGHVFVKDEQEFAFDWLDRQLKAQH